MNSVEAEYNSAGEMPDDFSAVPETDSPADPVPDYTSFNKASQTIFEVGLGSDLTGGTGIFDRLRDADTRLRGRDMGPMKIRAARLLVYESMARTGLFLDTLDRKLEDRLFGDKDRVYAEGKVPPIGMRIANVISKTSPPVTPNGASRMRRIRDTLRTRVAEARQKATPNRIRSGVSVAMEQVVDKGISMAADKGVETASGVEGAAFVSPAAELVATIANFSTSDRIRDRINGVSVEARWRQVYQAPVIGVPAERLYDWANEKIEAIEESPGKNFLKGVILAGTKGAIRAG